VVGALVAGMVAGLWGVTGWAGFLYYLAMHAVVRPAQQRGGLLTARDGLPCRAGPAACRATRACCPPPRQTALPAPGHQALLRTNAARLSHAAPVRGAGLAPRADLAACGRGRRLALAPAAPPPAARAGGPARPPGLSGRRARAQVCALLL
jgi:hypothetical protein